MDSNELERPESGMDEAPIGTFMLELSTTTKFGLDGAPIGAKLGVELLDAASAGLGGPVVGD